MPGVLSTPGLVYCGQPILKLPFYFRWLTLAGFLVARSSLAGHQRRLESCFMQVSKIVPSFRAV